MTYQANGDNDTDADGNSDNAELPTSAPSHRSVRTARDYHSR